MKVKLVIGFIIIAVLVLAVFILSRKAENQTIHNQTNNQQAVQPCPAQPATSSAMAATSQANVSFTRCGFEPQTVTIKAGGKVVWLNKSGEMGNVSSDVHPTHLLYPPLNLGNFADGFAVSLVFDKPGTYTYHDHLNPSQKGTVIVQ